MIALSPMFGAARSACALLLFSVLFAWVMFRRGRDSNHVDRAVVPAPGALLVDAAYHALHHAYPDRYMSSFTTVFDRLAGTGCALAGRRVAMTGATGALGAPLKEMLEREGAQVTGLRSNVVYTYDDYGRLDAALQGADILVLAHGSKTDHAMDANCASFVAIIERFRALHRGDKLPVEVWAVGSEIECHPAWGDPDLRIYLESKRTFARRARHYFHDRSVV
ncbi:hypothetical protein [Sorangium sp. So ce362]|uniref:hypothetical protein n=1 Tax=Sorangium sp. So ce362 TaxID=3133303 RepID=UPI003F5F4BAC